MKNDTVSLSALQNQRDALAEKIHRHLREVEAMKLEVQDLDTAIKVFQKITMPSASNFGNADAAGLGIRSASPTMPQPEIRPALPEARQTLPDLILHSLYEHALIGEAGLTASQLIKILTPKGIEPGNLRPTLWRMAKDGRINRTQTAHGVLWSFNTNSQKSEGPRTEEHGPSNEPIRDLTNNDTELGFGFPSRKKGG